MTDLEFDILPKNIHLSDLQFVVLFLCSALL